MRNGSQHRRHESHTKTKALGERILRQGHCITALSPKAVTLWNSLPNYVVDVQSIDIFKVRLDKFWAQQEVMFDWTADLTGTGDRSEYTVESD